jgi:two-component system, OmpR family, sensor histidine kinase KdpD
MSSLQQRRGLRDRTDNQARDDDNAESPRLSARRRNLVTANVGPIVATLALVWFATVGLVVANSFAPLDFVPLIYMLPVVVAATQWGIVAGLVAAVAGAAAADFFFYPPLYSFWLQNTQDVIHLLLFLLVATVTSNLAARLKNEAVAVRRSEKEIRDLHTFSQGLAACLTSRDLIFAVQDYLSNTLRCRAVLLAAGRDDRGPAEAGSVPNAIRQAAIEMIAANASQPLVMSDPDSGRTWLVRVILPQLLGYGAIAIELADSLRGEGTEAVAQRVAMLLEEATSTLKHLEAKEAIDQATIDHRTEVLRDALIGSVSHELRTPIASILGSCSVLNQMPAMRDDCRAQDLIGTIHDQAGHLDSQIRDLLDAARIRANGIHPQLTWTDPTDIVSAALKLKERRLASHRITLDLAHDLPLVRVDSVLVEQALGQLLENAAKYSPVGSEIEVSGRCEQEHVVLAVKDRGSGLTADEKGQLGKRSFRGKRHLEGTSGSGLGLWIASIFIAANGGALHAESSGPNLGTIISMLLPTVSADRPEFAGAFND